MDGFTGKTDALKSAINEIAASIATITSAIDEGARGVTSAAESTQIHACYFPVFHAVSREKAGICVVSST